MDQMIGLSAPETFRSTRPTMRCIRWGVGCPGSPQELFDETADPEAEAEMFGAMAHTYFRSMLMGKDFSGNADVATWPRHRPVSQSAHSERLAPLPPQHETDHGQEEQHRDEASTFGQPPQ
jgi:hypothetical protein